MTRPRASSVVKLCGLLVALGCVLAMPKGFAFPADEILIGNEEMLPPMPEQVDKPKSCFHFFVSRNMSSLLSDATKMLRQVRDRREREWILTFIYRIKSLAEHLRSHPEARNYDCLPNDDEMRKKGAILSDHARLQQPELYFVDDVASLPNSKRAAAIQASSQKGEGEIDSDHSARSDDEAIGDNQSSHQSASNPPNGQSSSIVQEADSHPVFSSAEEKSYILHQELADQPSNPAEEPGRPEIAQNQNSLQPMPEPDSSTLSNANREAQHVKVEDKRDRDAHNAIVISSTPDCDSTADCSRKETSQLAPPNHPAPSVDYSFDSREEDPLVQELHSRQREQRIEEERLQHEALKKRIRKALLEELAPEVKKLRTVGGSQEDLINLWKLSGDEVDKSSEPYQDADFDYEETGAAAGDLNFNDRFPASDRTVAPSAGEVRNTKKQSSKESVYEPYDDSDVLVQQLFDVRFDDPPSKTTRSLSDQNEEYLITSTHIPY